MAVMACRSQHLLDKRTGARLLLLLLSLPLLLLWLR